MFINNTVNVPVFLIIGVYIIIFLMRIDVSTFGV